ncbi:hypothetical protein BO70DRAFT_19239 [Aspergillus heteromorphus CBS 117.55]|uniref:Uncharacterized protein n=1 Tax=Aspergillus heteromorphus CBS 117.55 TaxID=1448321 RepID=A0A317X2C1_9EURO|nr:uncharacterized protein BO70DRAFT_19239 [Aspergillus heteromorphus CBS 117.55]PWY92784.1 hypothetical protein BO70DRAFT_19239 [Aspergillus heteromorphus CBS 117.55]
MSTCIPATNQPFPAFYIYRPGYTVVPLIPLDELPTWIQIGNFDWSNSELYEFMLPASFTCFDRVGEYDVICHHCYAGVDSFHRSVSERSESSAASSRADDQLCHLRAPLAGVVAGPSVVGDLLREETGKLAELRQPPFHASLNSPFVGMCFIPSWLKRTFYPRTTVGVD